MAAAPGYLLLAKAVSYAVSVVKGQSCSRWSRYKPCMKRGKCLVWLPAALFGYINRFLTFYIWKNDISTTESIPARFCKLNRH